MQARIPIEGMPRGLRVLLLVFWLALGRALLTIVTRLPLTMRPSGLPGEHLVFLANGAVWAIGILAA